MTLEQRIFNYKLSRGRRVVENLSNRLRIFLTTINLKPQKVQDITLACCALINFVKAESPTQFEDDFEKNLVFKFGLSKQSGNRPKNLSLDTRDEFKNYFKMKALFHGSMTLKLFSFPLVYLNI